MSATVIIHSVIKSPVDMDGTVQFVGSFTSRERAEAACVGAGSFTIYSAEINRAYPMGRLLDVAVIDVPALGR